jgi:hypothetical protein
LLRDGSLAEAVERSIDTQDQFTIPVTIRDVCPKSAELVLVSLRETAADYAGVSKGGQVRQLRGSFVFMVNLPRWR